MSNPENFDKQISEVIIKIEEITEDSSHKLAEISKVLILFTQKKATEGTLSDKDQAKYNEFDKLYKSIKGEIFKY